MKQEQIEETALDDMGIVCTEKLQDHAKYEVRGERIYVIGIMTSTGIPDLHVVRGGVDGDEFLNFLEKHLLPCLMPFNGTNENSVVIVIN